MPRYSVHIDKPSARGYKTSKIIEAGTPAEAKAVAEQRYGCPVIRVITIPAGGSDG